MGLTTVATIKAKGRMSRRNEGAAEERSGALECWSSAELRWQGFIVNDAMATTPVAFKQAQERETWRGAALVRSSRIHGCSSAGEWSGKYESRRLPGITRRDPFRWRLSSTRENECRAPLQNYRARGALREPPVATRFGQTRLWIKSRGVVCHVPKRLPSRFPLRYTLRATYPLQPASLSRSENFSRENRTDCPA